MEASTAILTMSSELAIEPETTRDFERRDTGILMAYVVRLSPDANAATAVDVPG
jgi:hypothetical protein